MPRITQATSEIIKRRLFRAREHLQCLDVLSSDLTALFGIAQASYEFCRAFNLPAVKHIEGAPDSRYLADAIQNFTTIIEYDITLFVLDREFEEAVVTAQTIMQACHQIPLPEAPPSPLHP